MSMYYLLHTLHHVKLGFYELPARDSYLTVKLCFSISSRDVPSIDSHLPVNPGLQFAVNPAGQEGGLTAPGLKPLDCLINEEYRVNCQWDGEEVFVPFSFLEKYYEVKIKA